MSPEEKRLQLRRATILTDIAIADGIALLWSWNYLETSLIRRHGRAKAAARL